MSRRKLRFHSRRERCALSLPGTLPDDSSMECLLPSAPYLHGTLPDASSESVERSDELIVALPLAPYLSGTLPDASSLLSRLTRSNKVPADWNVSRVHGPATPTPYDGDYLAVYKLQVLPPLFCISHSFMITVAPNCTWSLCIGSSNIEQCTLLRGTPNRLSNVDAVVKVVLTLSGSKFCGQQI